MTYTWCVLFYQLIKTFLTCKPFFFILLKDCNNELRVFRDWFIWKATSQESFMSYRYFSGSQDFSYRNDICDTRWSLVSLLFAYFIYISKCDLFLKRGIRLERESNHFNSLTYMENGPIKLAWINLMAHMRPAKESALLDWPWLIL